MMTRPRELSAPAPSTMLRVFVSSTFRDMAAEREELAKRVFPKIRRLCESRDLLFTEIDLRWGVSDEERAHKEFAKSWLYCKRAKAGLVSRVSPIAAVRPHIAVFISYRRADSADVCGRIRDRLIAHFGPESVFIDVASIALGDDFRDAVKSAISRCDAVLVVMGPSWLTATDQQGRCRFEDKTDPVRIEIETALARGKRLVPLLAGGAGMPKPDDLPESLRPLTFRTGRQIRPDPDFHLDMDALVQALSGAAPTDTSAEVDMHEMR